MPPPYVRTLPVRGLANLERSGIKLYDELTKDKSPAQAVRVRQAILSLERELQGIGHRMAREGTKIMRDTLEARRSRPSTRGLHPGEAHLGDSIASEAVTAVPGAVGLGVLSELNDKTPWWWTQEKGYAGHVGRMVYGYFFDGAGGRHAPSQGERGQHPIFTASKPGQRMRIQEPILAKWFLRDGSAKAEALWHTLVQGARTQFTREVVAATAAPGAARPPRGRRPRRRSGR